MRLKAFFLIVILSCFNIAHSQTNELPHLVKKDDRHALIVDGEPLYKMIISHLQVSTDGG